MSSPTPQPPGQGATPGTGDQATQGPYQHQEYDPNGPVPPIIPGIPGLGPVIERAQELAQRANLGEGLTYRPAGSAPTTNAAAYSHEELKQNVETVVPDSATEVGQAWTNLGNRMMDFGNALAGTANSSQAHWQGQAGEAARTALTQLAGWSGQTGQGLQFTATNLRTQAEAGSAVRTMPDPVPYEPEVYYQRMLLTDDPAEWAAIAQDARDQYDRHMAAWNEAVDMTNTYAQTLRTTDATMPAFAPPPTFSGDGSDGGVSNGTDGGIDQRGGPPSVNPGSPGNPAVAPPTTTITTGTSGPSWTGNPVQTPVPTVPTGTPPTTAVPGLPGGPGVPTGPSGPGTPGHPPGTGLPGYPGGPNGPGRPGGPNGPGGVRPGVGTGPNTGAGGRSGFGTGRGFGPGGGGFGPGGSGAGGPGSGSGSGGTGTGTGSGAGPRSAGAAGEGVGGRGAGVAGEGAGSRGAGGRGAGGGLPLGGGHGQRDEDKEHKRPSYLVESEDVWGDGKLVAPPVIGEAPPEHYRRDR